VREASRLGRSVWIVGGALRDLLLDRPVTELDLAVSSDPQGLALALTSAGMGTAVLLSEETPRVIRVAGTRDLDIAEIVGGSIEADLARRDFTINAIACALPEPNLIDPFGGIADLARGRLRAVSERNLQDDPLRVLRAARLIATHRLVPDAALTTASRLAAGGLSDVAGERIRTELVKLLGAKTAAPALQWLRSARALETALGRDPGTFDRTSFSRFDDPLVVRSSSSARVRIRLGLLASVDHLSPSEAAAWLGSRRFSRTEAGDVAEISKLAMRVRRLRTPRDRWEWIHDAAERRSEAAILAALLFPSRRRFALLLARPLPAPRLRVGGRDVLAWLGVAPGPLVGRLLREVEIEILRGAIRTRRDARRWLLGRFGGLRNEGANVGNLPSKAKRQRAAGR